MDLTHPIRAVVPALDASVLEVLAATSRPLSGREVAKLAGKGSPSGIRLALQRMAGHGLVDREDRGSAIYYTANRAHVAWPAVEALTSLSGELERRIAHLVKGWEIAPLTVAMFGSAARREGSVDSDIDLLVVAPSGVWDLSVWDSQCHDLAESVESWAGNRVQLYPLDQEALRAHVERSEPIVAQWQKDARTLAGQDIRDVLREISE